MAKIKAINHPMVYTFSKESLRVGCGIKQGLQTKNLLGRRLIVSKTHTGNKQHQIVNYTNTAANFVQVNTDFWFLRVKFWRIFTFPAT